MSERFAQMGNRLYYSPGSHYVGLGSQMQQIAIDAERQDRAIAELQAITGLSAEVCRDRMAQFAATRSSDYWQSFSLLKSWLMAGTYDLEQMQRIPEAFSSPSADQSRDRPTSPVLQSSIN